MTLAGNESPDAAVSTFLSERVKQRKLGAFGFSPGAEPVFSSWLSAEVKANLQLRLEKAKHVVQNNAENQVSPCVEASSLTAVNFMSW